MSTTIAVNDKQVVKLSPPKQDESWNVLKETLGYPDTWISYLASSLAKQGKQWRWKPVAQTGGNVLLVINSNTPNKAVTSALLLADKCEASVSVVYTAKPPVVSEIMSSGEADQLFAYELQEGGERLQAIANEGKNLDVKVSTNFIWAESSSKVSKRIDADLVIDETA